MTNLTDSVETNAQKPRAVTVDGTTAEQHSLSEQIAAAKFVAARDAMEASGNADGNGMFGIRLFKFRPGGGS